MAVPIVRHTEAAAAEVADAGAAAGKQEAEQCSLRIAAADPAALEAVEPAYSAAHLPDRTHLSQEALARILAHTAPVPRLPAEAVVPHTVLRSQLAAVVVAAAEGTAVAADTADAVGAAAVVVADTGAAAAVAEPAELAEPAADAAGGVAVVAAAGIGAVRHHKAHPGRISV
jgi:hypothetical protein